MGNTALMLASGEGRNAIVKLLIENGANINTQNNIGNTALLLASWDIHNEVVYLLLSNGANKHHTNKKGLNALQLAQQIISCGKIIDWLI